MKQTINIIIIVLLLMFSTYLLYHGLQKDYEIKKSHLEIEMLKKDLIDEEKENHELDKEIELYKTRYYDLLELKKWHVKPIRKMKC